MTDEFLIVDIWFRSFPSKSLFIQYFEEQYIDDHSPINKFAADQDVLFYDHDYCEFEFHSHPIKSFDELIGDHSYWKFYVDEEKKAFLANDQDEANVTVLIFGKKIVKPRSVSGKDFRLGYLGKFACDSNL